jgi:dolichol-phosphate mannosyltransferase
VQRNDRGQSRPGQLSDVTVVVPTRNEADSIAPLLARLLPLGPARVVFVDDSDDNTPAVVDAVDDPVVLLLHRPVGARNGGLAGAVIEGFCQVTTPWVAVMDADLQHPPEVLLSLRDAAITTPTATATGTVTSTDCTNCCAGTDTPPVLSLQADVVIASRYRHGGSSDGLDGLHRKLLSRYGTRLVRLAGQSRLTDVSDPLSGCFLIRTDRVPFERLHPDGFKVLLDILLSAPQPLRVAEVGFEFGRRAYGESSASFVEIIRLLRVVLRRRRRS